MDVDLRSVHTNVQRPELESSQNIRGGLRRNWRARDSLNLPVVVFLSRTDAKYSSQSVFTFDTSDVTGSHFSYQHGDVITSPGDALATAKATTNPSIGSSGNNFAVVELPDKVCLARKRALGYQWRSVHHVRLNLCGDLQNTILRISNWLLCTSGTICTTADVMCW